MTTNEHVAKAKEIISTLTKEAVNLEALITMKNNPDYEGENWADLDEDDKGDLRFETIIIMAGLMKMENLEERHFAIRRSKVGKAVSRLFED